MPLQAVDDDALLGLQARGDDAQAVDVGAERDLAVGRPCCRRPRPSRTLVLVGADRAFADQQGRARSSPGPCAAARTGRASGAPSVLSNTRAHAHRAALRHRPGCRRAAAGRRRRARSVPAVPICTGIRPMLRARAGAARQLRRAPGDDLLVGVEAGVDRAHRDQRRQHRRAGTRGNQVADRDLEPADAACDRRRTWCSRG